MRNNFLILALILFSSLSVATTATYTGEQVKEGPETEYLIGFASDQNMTVQIEVEESRDLNFTYNSTVEFVPSEASRVIQRDGRSLSLIEIPIRVESSNISREEYLISVSLSAYAETSSSGTRPRVIQEREYEFSYLADSSRDFGLDGELIDREQQDQQEVPDQTLNISDEENPLTEGNQSEGERGEVEDGINRTTYALIGLILLLILYIMREAFS